MPENHTVTENFKSHRKQSWSPLFQIQDLRPCGPGCWVVSWRQLESYLFPPAPFIHPRATPWDSLHPAPSPARCISWGKPDWAHPCLLLASPCPSSCSPLSPSVSCPRVPTWALHLLPQHSQNPDLWWGPRMHRNGSLRQPILLFFFLDFRGDTQN